MLFLILFIVICFAFCYLYYLILEIQKDIDQLYDNYSKTLNSVLKLNLKRNRG